MFSIWLPWGSSLDFLGNEGSTVIAISFSKVSRCRNNTAQSTHKQVVNLLTDTDNDILFPWHEVVDYTVRRIDRVARLNSRHSHSTQRLPWGLVLDLRSAPAILPAGRFR